MRPHFLHTLFTLATITGCANSPPPDSPPSQSTVLPQHIGWTKNSWRVCEGDACLAPTPKTIVIAAPRPVVVSSSRPATRTQDVEVRKPLVIHFEFAKAIPTKDGMSSLEKTVATIRAEDTLRIEGHTDDLGRQDINDKLARKRAEYVTAWLRQRGIKNPMEIESHGKCCYAVPNDTEEKRARNRRVEVGFLIKEANK